MDSTFYILIRSLEYLFVQIQEYLELQINKMWKKSFFRKAKSDSRDFFFKLLHILRLFQTSIHPFHFHLFTKDSQ